MKMVGIFPESVPIYRSAIDVPNKYEQLVRYLGYYSKIHPPKMKKMFPNRYMTVHNFKFRLMNIGSKSTTKKVLES